MYNRETTTNSLSYLGEAVLDLLISRPLKKVPCPRENCKTCFLLVLDIEIGDPVELTISEETLDEILAQSAAEGAVFAKEQEGEEIMLVFQEDESDVERIV